MNKPENTLSKTESSLSKSDIFVELPLIREVKMGNTLQQSEYRQVVGMYSIYSVVKEFRGCFKGKFWHSTVLLYYLKAIYLPILKSLVHMYEKWQMNRLWLTQIYLYRWYIPDLIRLANGIESKPSPAVVDNIDSSKTICAPYSSSNILSSLSNRQFICPFTNDY